MFCEGSKKSMTFLMTCHEIYMLLHVGYYEQQTKKGHIKLKSGSKMTQQSHGRVVSMEHTTFNSILGCCCIVSSTNNSTNNL